MKINKELMKGSTSILVLALLSREDMYGYQISRRLSLDTGNIFEMKEGTLYPMLHSLENEKAVESYWLDAENSKRRKYYRITDHGRKLLNEKQHEWESYSNAINTVLGGACYE